jgi:Caspase domain
MKKNILTLLLFIVFSHINAQTLHLIMVSDYAQPTFGTVSQADEETINDIFGTVAIGLNYKLKVSNLNTFNKNFSKVEVLKNFETLKTNPEDIVVFFYSGEGVFAAKSDYPIFKLKDYDINNNLSVDDVANTIKTLGVRLGIVIAECRNTELVRPNTPPPLRGTGVVEDLRKLIIPKLFLEPCGIYKVSSMSRGNVSWKMPYTQNSAFIYSFSNEFKKYLGISKSEAISSLNFDNLMKKTKVNVNESLKDFVPTEKAQTIQWNFTPCELTKSLTFKQYPASDFVIYSQKELKEKLTNLANTSGPARNTIIATLSDMFQKGAVLEITIKNPSNVGNPEKLKLSIEQYIDLTSKYTHNFHRTITFKVQDFKRTEDFKKFSYLRFTEEIK